MFCTTESILEQLDNFIREKGLEHKLPSILSPRHKRLLCTILSLKNKPGPDARKKNKQFLCTVTISQNLELYFIEAGEENSSIH